MGHSYRDLIVWQKAIAMVTEIYRATQSFPRQETYGLTSQVRRSAVSVASNIAEGQGRLSRREFHYFLSVARGSLIEMETQIVIAENLGYLSPAEVRKLADASGEVSRLLPGLMQALQKTEPHPTRN
jgi:four helix bundle protein